MTKIDLSLNKIVIIIDQAIVSVSSGIIQVLSNVIIFNLNKQWTRSPSGSY